ncbi:spore germination protein [Paenibacillus sp. MY03]|uniref:spore germination protein n=1 Tax=Paenibacillus sp. MY03 TaxID=302980 RepID=UPI000B3C7ED6|nr:spore germination protein [Paenibacillus sp. MY03]OUS76953.1 spore germination protein [Paenibacillus sp. MY03]
MKQSETSHERPFQSSLKANVRAIYERFGGSSDLVVRLFRSDAAPERELALMYIRGIVDESTINESVLSPLMSMQLPKPAGKEEPGLLEALRTSILSVGQVKDVLMLEEAIQLMTGGMCLIAAEGHAAVLMAGVGGGEQRSVDSALTQTVIRGPQRGFVEDLNTNVSLIRRIIRSPNLHVQTHKIGSETHTDVAVLYMNGIADEAVVKEVYRRLADIEIDGVLESGYIEEFIQDETFTLFPTLMNTERPDTVAASLLEGRVAIVVEGTPIALIAPITLFNFFQSTEDYYHRFDIASFVRMIRYGAYAVSMLLPALYIAVTTFHQELLPTTLLISLAAQREGVPFPGLVEALLMVLAFEVLSEAGFRMPRAIGSAISIIGALVLGQAAVQAGIVSAGIVIVVSFTAIASFVMPEFNIAATSRIIRFGLMLVAGFLGFFGLFIAILFILVHLASLRSFGVPYMSPVAPGASFRGLWRDVFVRIPWWAIVLRPQDLKLRNPKRMKRSKRPIAQRQIKKP